MFKNLSKLVDGLIPKFQKCPFEEECDSDCAGKDEKRQCAYSCGLARAMDIVDRRTQQKISAEVL